MSERRRIYCFDNYRADPVKRVLLRDGEIVPLTPKAFAILLVLLERAGEVVEKTDLVRQVWPGQYISEGNLTQNIWSLRKALGERGNEPRYIVTVPGRGYSFACLIEESTQADSGVLLLPGLPADPAPPSGPEETAAAAAGPPSVPVRPALPFHPLRHWLLPPAVGGAAVLIVVLAAVSMRRGIEPPPPRAEAPRLAATAVSERRPCVAVLGFRNLSRDGAGRWLGPALAEMLTTELAAGPGVRVASGEEVARALQVLGLSIPDQPGPAALGRLQQLLGADRVIVGTYLFNEAGEGDDPPIRLDLRILAAADGRTLTTLSQTGAQGELFDLVARTGNELRHALRLSDPSPLREQEARALLPASPETARLYTEALGRLRSSDPAGARDILLQAVQAEPGSAVLRSALSQAWSALGYDARAKEEAQRAVDLGAALPRAKRLEIEARLWETSKEWERASEIWRSLWTFYPDDREYGLRLAASLAAAGHGAGARDIIKALRQLPPPAGDDPRIDLTEALVAKRLSDPTAEMRAAQAAVQKGRRSGETLVVAQALLLQGDALLLTGRAADAVGLFQAAKMLFEGAGDQMAVCRALTHIGAALHEQSDLAGAEAKHREALVIAERLGSLAGVASQLGNLGFLASDRGDLTQARELLEQSYSQYVRLQDRVLAARTLNALAEILRLQGDLKGARQRFEQVLAISRETGNRTEEGWALSSLGMILENQGRLADARRRHEEAFHLMRASGDPNRAAMALAASAETMVRLGDIDGARRRYGYALTAKRRSGDRIGAAQILGSLADLASLTGDFATARTLSDEQLRIGQETGAQSTTTAALGVRGRYQLAAGDLAGARASLTRAWRETQQRGEAQGAQALRLDLAELALAAGNTEEALTVSREAAAWYARHGIPAEEARAQALAAEALLTLGRAAEARQAAGRARTLVTQSEDRLLPLTLAAHLATVEAAAGNPARARQDLRWAAIEAAKLGLHPTGRDAQLRLAKLTGPR